MTVYEKELTKDMGEGYEKGGCEENDGEWLYN